MTEPEEPVDYERAAALFDAFIKSEWQDIFRTQVRVELDNGSRYVPNGGSQGVSLLRKNVNAFDEAIRLWRGPTDEPIGSSQGYDRIVDQAGIQCTWEWFLVEEGRPWAAAVPLDVRARVEEDLARRRDGADKRASASQAEKDRLAEAEDDRTIALMNAKRAEDGRPLLTAEQEASVRDGRRARRAASA